MNQAYLAVRTTARLYWSDDINSLNNGRLLFHWLITFLKHQIFFLGMIFLSIIGLLISILFREGEKRR
jgi:hypothetical protein